METKLNPYTIKWNFIFVHNGIVTEAAMAQLARIGYTRMNGKKVIQRHNPNEEVAKQNEQKALAILKKHDKGGQSFIITDKQFGEGRVNYGGAGEVSLQNSKFLVITNDAVVSTFPITEEQIKASVKF